MPAWHHLLRVSNLLNYTLAETKEGPANERFIIPLSALGHDLLEDTNANEEEIASLFSERGLALIRGMTNRLGDKNHGPYIKYMVRAEEAVRLIKLSDLYDNFASVAYNLALLGIPWTRTFFLPIVRPMQARIVTTKFFVYKKSAARLIILVNLAAKILDSEMRREVGYGKNKNGSH